MTNEKIKTMGQKIRFLRVGSEFTLQELADKAEVSKPHIYELEHDKVNNPSIKLIQRLAVIFNVSTSYFLESNPQMQFQVTSRQLQMDFNSFDEQDREVVQLVVKALKERKES